MKRCWICKHSEKEFLAQKQELLKQLEQELLELEKYEQDVVRLTSEKLGFTEAAKAKAQSIKKAYAEMTVSAVLENSASFLELEPNLSVIVDYCTKVLGYDARKYKTVQNLIDAFVCEPIEQRYQQESREIREKRQALQSKQKEIEALDTIFFEKQINLGYGRLGFNLGKKLCICPYCSAMFKEAASAAFAVKEAESAAYDDDWDDDDDF